MFQAYKKILLSSGYNLVTQLVYELIYERRNPIKKDQ